MKDGTLTTYKSQFGRVLGPGAQAIRERNMNGQESPSYREVAKRQARNIKSK